MTGYRNGTSPQGEIDAIKEHFALAAAAIQAWPDAAEAFEAVTTLAKLGRQMDTESTDLRKWLAAYLADQRGMSYAQLSAILGISKGRIGQLVREGRLYEGNPVMDPGTFQVQPAIALAIITGNQGVLVAHRRDKIPPWTFPGGEVQNGETPAAAMVRRVLAETGLTVTPVTIFGQRIHPMTSRHMIYMAATVPDDAPAPRNAADDPDLDELRWMGLNEVRDAMPDMFEAVRGHLETVLGNVGVFQSPAT